VLICVPTQLNGKLVLCDRGKTHECIGVELKIEMEAMCILLLYRPPQANDIKPMIDVLNGYVTRSDCIITGDPNMRNIGWHNNRLLSRHIRIALQAAFTLSTAKSGHVVLYRGRCSDKAAKVQEGAMLVRPCDNGKRLKKVLETNHNTI
jgi:hypothetical protein